MKEARLFRSEFHVRPNVNHPRYWEIKFGLLFIWTTSKQPDLALRTSHEIAKLAPYELTEDLGKVSEENLDDVREEFKAPVSMALSTGLSSFLMGFTTGSDVSEEEFRSL